MKRIVYLICCIFIAIGASAQSAKQVLDRTAAIVGRSGGASASFKITSGNYGSTSGTIAIKGKKFFASTTDAKVWFDGTTQWAYMKATDEVNISTPTQAEQMSMNPYTFITLYNTGYKMSMQNKGGNYQIHLIAKNQKRTVQELYITVNKSYHPTLVKMRNGKTWTTISISNFKAQNQNDATFRFTEKLCPGAEIIDLR